MRKETHFSY